MPRSAAKGMNCSPISCASISISAVTSVRALSTPGLTAIRFAPRSFLPPIIERFGQDWQTCERPGRLLPVGHPDVLDLGGMAQEGLALAFRGEPVARSGVAPGGLQVPGRAALDQGDAFGAAEIPVAGDLVMLREGLGQEVALAGHDVDHAGRHVA